MAELPQGSSMGSRRVCVNQWLKKPQKYIRFWVNSFSWELSHLAHPHPGPRCYTASPSNPLCILHALLREGYYAATIPFHMHGHLCCVTPKCPTSVQGRFLGRSRRMEKEIKWDTPMSHRIPESEVVLLDVVALHGFLLHWVTQFSENRWALLFTASHSLLLWLTCIWCEENRSFSSFSFCFVILSSCHERSLHPSLLTRKVLQVPVIPLQSFLLYWDCLPFSCAGVSQK